MRIFWLSYNSRSSEVFVGSSCKLKFDGGLILLLYFFACYFLIYVNAVGERSNFKKFPTHTQDHGDA